MIFNNKPKKFSIRLSQLFTILLSTIVAILISYNAYKSYNLSYIMLNKIQKEITQNIITLTDKTLEISSTYVNMLSNINGDDNDILANKTTLISLMNAQIKAYKYLDSIYIANNNGDFIQVKKSSDVKILRGIDNNKYDPRKRIWFKDVNHKIYWSKPYRYASSNNMGITVSSAIFDKNNSKIKVAGADITATKLYKFVVSQARKIGGEIIVFDNNKDIITSSLNNKNIINSHIINKAFKNLREGILKDNNGVKYLSFISHFPKTSNMNWNILVVIPQEVILGDLLSTIIETILISIIILIIFIFIVIFVSYRLSNPIVKISNQIKDIEALNLSINITNNSEVEEIYQTQLSLKSLQIALSSFIKYLPVVLIQKLIKAGCEAKVGGEERDLAIMFTDIENFTTISESMTPSAIAYQLSEYFEIIDNSINNREGTIDKYIGDAVLAFWGAPENVDNPSLKAIESALEIRENLEILNKKWAKEGKEIFKTRIGIHYGKTLVGNIGSNYRLNYTVIGDSVNIASRLEYINKDYGTYLLFSDRVKDNLGNKYKSIYIDSVLLKGKQQPTKFYTIK
ncbi:Adenylate cyclase [hydrothermal vent metagenome]|uniref:Adenylate cyclase n=1 Tax=hydrothermal vent metagenome TaxID=652676 RepID=A0A1W1EJL3_9ZZZZ